MAAVSSAGRAVGLEPLHLIAGSQATAVLYERHSQRVFAYCLSKLGRREDAEDAVQTTFLHAMRGLRRGVVPDVEIAWVLAIARNVCHARWESVGRRGRLELVCDPVDLERNAAPEHGGDELIGLEEALALLPERQRQAVLLRDWRGLSYEEVASQLGVSLANAETLIFRGRRSLADRLRERPDATRRRLGSLGNLGSLLAALKTALTGAAAATKIAAAVGVVAVSGAGIAAGTDALGSRDTGGSVTPRRAAPVADVRHGDPVDAATRIPALPAAPLAVATPAPPAPPTASSRGVPGRRAADPTPAATPPTAAAAGAPAHEPSRAATPAAPAAAVPKTPPIADALPAPQPTVQRTVDEVLPQLPVDTPRLPEPIGSLPVPPLPIPDLNVPELPPLPFESPPVVGTVVAALPALPLPLEPPHLLP